MSLKNKVGNFLILFGLIGLLVFVASVLAPPESFDSAAFLVGAALIGVGLNFRLSKVRPRAGGPPGGGGGGPPPAAPAAAPRKAQRQGLFSTILSGPNNKKSGPATGGGKPGGGGGGGKPGGGGGKGGPGGGGGKGGGGGGRK